MEALLPPRFANVAAGVLAVVLAVAAAWVALVPAPPLDPTVVQTRVEKDCDRMEAVLIRRVEAYLKRSDDVASAFASGRLSAADLGEKEALVIEKDGVITDYAGEIYFFKPFDASKGNWRLIRKSEELYFQRRVDARTCYLRFFMDMRSNPVRKSAGFSYPVFDLKFFGNPLPEARSDFSYDEAQERFYCTRVFKSTRNQLILSLAFSSATLERHALRLRKIVAYGLAFLTLFVLFLVFGRGPGSRWLLAFFTLAGMATAAWRAIEWIGPRDIYFPHRPDAVRSVFQLAILFLCLFIGVRLVLDRVRAKSNWLALIVFNLGAAAALFFVDAVARAADFPFGDFSLRPDYLGLLLLVTGLYAAPLLMAAPLLEPTSVSRAGLLLLPQLALVVACIRWCRFPLLLFPLLALIFVVLSLSPGRPWVRVFTPLVLLVLAVGIALNQYSLSVKRAFIRDNLKPVFSSQDDYAKLMAREIVYELNSRNIPFSAFFESDDKGELADCWKNSLAARENIASGIHVVAAAGSLLHSFSYQIPYIPLHKGDIFPFWHVENVDAQLFGKRVRLAVATINVFKEGRHLGFIMVQVLNTLDLVLKSGEPRQSVLTADRRIRDAGIGYVKLDETGGILENPANMNISDLGRLTRSGDAWVEFASMGVGYGGYVFKGAEEASIVFFPRDTFFKSFSEYVKILVFLLLLSALLNLRRLRRYSWRLVFGSFSVKVFAMLVLLSILTASVFSIFSLNFNTLSQETRRSQAAHRRGRSAMAIVANILANGGQISQSDLFLLDKILETEVSVYENDNLLFTSNHRKLIRSELPVYLESSIRDRLRKGNQPFELRKSGSALNLFFQTPGNYVFRMEFPADSAEQVRARRYYSDFLVTIFFVLIVIGLAAAFFFRDRILAPIHRLNSGMAAVRRGDLLPLDGIPAEVELRELYQGFNSMLEGIQEQKRNVSEIARMKTLVQLGRRVAHEVKNPLTPIRLSAEQIQRSLRDGGEGAREVIANAVRYIVEETEHLRRVAFGFLNLSKLDEVKAEPFRLDELVGEAMARVEPLYPRVRFSFAGEGETIDVVADRRKIRQVIDNVLTNALEALAGRDGHLDVSLAQEGEWAVVRVRDDGAGIAAEELERIACEEFSSKDLGTGLGLVIARRFLELHRGGLEIESTPGRGTTVTMRFAKNVHQT